MRNLTILSFLALTLTLLSGAPVQAQALQLGGNADCEGWSAMATLTFPAGVFSADLDYSVVLSDQSGAEVTRFDYATTLNRFEDPVMIRMYSEDWGLVLDSVYTVRLLFHFLGEEALLELPVVCGEGDADGDEPDEPQVEPCHHTFRYWRKNPELWPVEELEIGGRTFTRSQLIRNLQRPLRFHPSVSVVRHLVATKLNLAAGTDPSILPTVEAADQFLAERWDRWRGWWRHRSEARELRRALVAYNNLPCDGVLMFSGGGQLEVDKTFAEEPMTFSGLKAMYR